MGAIAGVLPLADGASRRDLIDTLERMRAAMAGRAPIAGGMAVAYDGSVALVHGAGAGPGGESVLQPLVDERGALWLVADGEPSNARELRLELIAAGHEFRSACGSEVILHLYEQDGVAALERLAGSFAFALWDRERHELVLGRDRFGIKPLYVAERAGEVAFASEVRALADGDVDPAALGAFLTLGYVPEPLTVAAEVRAVEPGTVVRVRGGRVCRERYWEEASVLPSGDSGADGAQLGWMVREAVEAAVAGEEDIGLLLGQEVAGAALLALVRPMLGRGLRTHALDFDGAVRAEELPARWRGLLRRPAPGATAAAVADWFAVDHHRHAVSSSMVAAALDVAAGSDQPSIGVPWTWLGAGALRASGARVWLSSLAAPGLFGGARGGAVPWLWRAGHYGSARRATCTGARAASRLRPFGRAAAIAGYLDRPDSAAAAYLAAHGPLPPGALSAVLRPDAAATALAAFDPIEHLDRAVRHPLGPPCAVPPRSASALLARALARIDLAGPLMAGALRDAEGTAAAQGLALRAPLLDHRVFEWLVTSGAGDRGAPLLRVLGTALPRAATQDVAAARPPLDCWMRTTLRPYVEDRLFARDPEGLFAPAGVAALWKAFLAGHVDWRAVWSLATARAWLAARRAARIELPTVEERPRRRRHAA